MHSLFVTTLLAGLAQQAPKPEFPSYVPPPPKPAVVQPAAGESPFTAGAPAVPPPPAAPMTLPQSAPPRPIDIEVEKIRADRTKTQTAKVKSFLYQVRHLPAEVLAVRLGKRVTARAQAIHGPLVIIPAENNRVKITTLAEHSEAVRKLIREIDREPKQFEVQAEIRTIDSEGKEIISRPKIITTEGRTARIQISRKEGLLELEIDVREISAEKTAQGSDDAERKWKIYPHPFWRPLPPRSVPARAVPPKPASPTLKTSYEDAASPHEGAQQPTESEKRIEEALGKPISLRFDDARLLDVVKQIHKTAGINMALDNMGLEEEGVSTNTPVSINVEAIPLKSALGIVLESLGLDYLIEDEVLKITGRDRARGPMKLLTYPVADLVVSSEDQPAINFENLVDLITTFVEPDSWAQEGGPAAIHESESTISLVIRQTDAGHAKIRTLLEGLRKIKGTEKEERVGVE